MLLTGIDMMGYKLVSLHNLLVISPLCRLCEVSTTCNEFIDYSNMHRKMNAHVTSSIALERMFIKFPRINTWKCCSCL